MKVLMIPCAAILFGGNFCGPVNDPCDQDRYDCEKGTLGFTTDATCTATDDLKVTVGTGEDGFEAIDGWPAVHSGSQGGHHIFTGLQVEGVESSAYDRLKLNIEVLDGGQNNGGRSMILKLAEGTNVVSPTKVEDFGLLVFVNTVQSGTIKLTVTDPCGRTGQDEHVAPSAQ